MLDGRSAIQTLNSEKAAVLLSWFALLLVVRLVLSTALQHMWIGTIGAVTITFAIFYIALRYTPLRRCSAKVDAVLLTWYRKRFFYISGIASIFLLASILGAIE